MKKTEKAIIICNCNFEIEAPVYRDAENHIYAKINKQYLSIETLKHLGYKIIEKSPG